MKDIQDNENLTPLIKKYYQIMNNYRKGLYGKEHLTMHEILNRAGEPYLFNMMSLDEIDYLLGTSTGQTRNFFTILKTKKQSNKDNEASREAPKGLKLTKSHQSPKKGQLA